MASTWVEYVPEMRHSRRNSTTAPHRHMCCLRASSSRIVYAVGRLRQQRVKVYISSGSRSINKCVYPRDSTNQIGMCAYMSPNSPYCNHGCGTFCLIVFPTLCAQITEVYSYRISLVRHHIWHVNTEKSYSTDPRCVRNIKTIFMYYTVAYFRRL